MNFGTIKKLLGYNSTKDKKSGIHDFFNNIQKSSNKFILNLRLMAKRSKNLSESNFKLGKKYYRNGNFSEATFRFTILTKFWPDHYEGYFMLAKSLLAQNKFRKAEKILNKLIRRKPAFKDRAVELLYSNKSHH
jgi:tetratricopeptide (TPR) repeat protein